VLTWLATSFPDLNDSIVVQYAFHAALSLQTKTEPLLSRNNSDSRALPPPSSALSALRTSKPPASSRSLSLQFFPPLLSNLVAASRAVVLFRLWDGGGAAGDKRLQRKEWEAGVRGLKRTALSRDALAAEWTALDADGKGAALFGEFCGWFRWAVVHRACCRRVFVSLRRFAGRRMRRAGLRRQLHALPLRTILRRPRPALRWAMVTLTRRICSMCRSLLRLAAPMGLARRIVVADHRLRHPRCSTERLQQSWAT
jgi:hypothetical protein